MEHATFLSTDKAIEKIAKENESLANRIEELEAENNKQRNTIIGFKLMSFYKFYKFRKSYELLDDI